MANEVTINVKANTAQATSAISALNKSWVGLNAGLSLAKQAAQALGEAYKFLAGDTMEYAAQVRQMMRVSGQSAEMTSRMIQLTDDFALSEGSLEAAMRGASMKGIAFTVDNLAKLSDEYLKLAPGTERNTMLIESFGRAGLEMAKVMEKGSDAIKAQGEAQADNLIMTQANLDAAEELRIAEDNLNDSFQGLKYTLGNAVIPELVKAANAFELILTWSDKLNRAIKDQGEELVKLDVPYNEYLEQMTAHAKQAGLVVDAQIDGIRVYKLTSAGYVEVANTLGILTRSEYGAKVATQDLTAEMRFITTYGPGAWGELNNLAGAADNAAGAIDGTNAKMDTLRAVAGEISQAYKDMNQSQDDLKAATESFGEKIGGDLKSQFEAAGLKGDELDEVLGYIDESLGTAYKPAKELEDMTAKLVQDFFEGGRDGEAFKLALQNMKGPMEELYTPLKKAREEAEKLRDVLLEMGAMSIKIAVQMGAPIAGGGPTLPTGGGSSGGGGGSTPPFIPGSPLNSFADGYSVAPTGGSGGGMTINTINVSLPSVTNAAQFAAELGRMANNALNSGRAYQGG